MAFLILPMVIFICGIFRCGPSLCSVWIALSSSPASWRQILGVISQGTSNKVWSIGDHVRYIPRTVGLNYADREPTTTELYSLRS